MKSMYAIYIFKNALFVIHKEKECDNPQIKYFMWYFQNYNAFKFKNIKYLYFLNLL